MRTIFNHFLYCSLTILIVLSCKKLEKIAKLPTVYLIGASKTTNTTIEVLGQFTWDGDSPILSKGLCYGLKENPTISDSTLEIPFSKMLWVPNILTALAVAVRSKRTAADRRKWSSCRGFCSSRAETN